MRDLTQLCSLALRNGRECLRTIPDDAPMTLCMKHLQEAYLYIADQIQARANLAAAAHRDVVTAMQPEPVVYYARIGNHVKIGTTINLRLRMSQLGVEELLATEPGGVELERERHKQFAHLHARRREYFQPAPDLLAHIERLRQAAVVQAA